MTPTQQLVAHTVAAYTEYDNSRRVCPKDGGAEGPAMDAMNHLELGDYQQAAASACKAAEGSCCFEDFAAACERLAHLAREIEKNIETPVA